LMLVLALSTVAMARRLLALSIVMAKIVRYQRTRLSTRGYLTSRSSMSDSIHYYLNYSRVILNVRNPYYSTTACASDRI
jgi:hypothetical protein